MSKSFESSRAPEPVGAFPHARRVGNLLFLSGIGPRVRGSKEIPGVTLDSAGNIASYDIEKQCEAVFENVRLVLEDAGATWNDIVDVEKGADLVRNQLAILDRHTTLFVDVDAEQEPMTLLPVLNVNEFETFRRNDGLDFLFNPFGQNAHMS